jgi:hypothetical protein
MKKRKSALLAFLLCAGFILGVGYASVTKNLNISGTGAATPNDANYIVKFAESVTTDKTHAPKATVTATRSSELAATFSVGGLTTKGEYVTATYTIENHSTEFKAQINSAKVQKASNDTSAFTSDYFEVTATLGAKTTLECKDNTTVDTTTVTIEVKLLKTPTENKDCSFYVVIPTEAVAL